MYPCSKCHHNHGRHYDHNHGHHHRKSVQFSRFLVVHETWCNDEYDRTSMEPARLTFKEASELLQLRCDYRRELAKLTAAAEAAAGEHMPTSPTSEVGSDTTASDSSSESSDDEKDTVGFCRTCPHCRADRDELI